MKLILGGGGGEWGKILDPHKVCIWIHYSVSEIFFNGVMIDQVG